MTLTDPLPIRLAQTLGLSTSLLLSGGVLTTSIYLVPRLLESPSPLLLRQWLHTYNLGKRTAPPMAILSSLSYLYLAYQTHASDPTDAKAWAYLTSGVLMAGIAPYTLTVMRGTNGKLIEKAGEMKGFKDGETVVEVGLGKETAHALVDWWGVLNLGRGVMLSVAGVLGVWTALN
jgi:hypothetical protein